MDGATQLFRQNSARTIRRFSCPAFVSHCVYFPQVSDKRFRLEIWIPDQEFSDNPNPFNHLAFPVFSALD
jgi:hypothetical protein